MRLPHHTDRFSLCSLKPADTWAAPHSGWLYLDYWTRKHYKAFTKFLLTVKEQTTSDADMVLLTVNLDMFVFCLSGNLFPFIPTVEQSDCVKQLISFMWQMISKNIYFWSCDLVPLGFGNKVVPNLIVSVWMKVSIPLLDSNPSIIFQLSLGIASWSETVLADRSQIYSDSHAPSSVSPQLGDSAVPSILLSAPFISGSVLQSHLGARQCWRVVRWVVHRPAEIIHHAA